MQSLLYNTFRKSFDIHFVLHTKMECSVTLHLSSMASCSLSSASACSVVVPMLVSAKRVCPADTNH